MLSLLVIHPKCVLNIKLFIILYLQVWLIQNAKQREGLVNTQVGDVP